MKKVLLALALLSCYSSFSMHKFGARVAAIAASTSPVTVPAAYYYKQDSYQNKNETIIPVRQFIYAASCVAVPPISIETSINNATALGKECRTALYEWSYGNDISVNADLIKEYIQKAFQEDKIKSAGYLGGASLYITVPMALKVLKRAKL